MRFNNDFFNSQIPKNLNLLFLVLFFVACNPNQIYRETNKELPLNRWMRNDPQVFTAKIVNINELYDVNLNFGHIYGFQFKEVPMEITIETPSGELIKKEFNLQILNDQKEDIGDCLGDICDVKYTFLESYDFQEQGNYTFTVSNNFDNMFLTNVLAVGIEILKI
ncbi:MAG: hypothetical protein HRT68_01350 [Flavobacteriaceae bacterium]|nr:hypothetical protein [Flavobacteriaceae bacterium]